VLVAVVTTIGEISRWRQGSQTALANSRRSPGRSISSSLIDKLWQARRVAAAPVVAHAIVDASPVGSWLLPG
jgi:hypothetical protein